MILATHNSLLSGPLDTPEYEGFGAWGQMHPSAKLRLKIPGATSTQTTVVQDCQIAIRHAIQGIKKVIMKGYLRTNYCKPTT